MIEGFCYVISRLRSLRTKPYPLTSVQNRIPRGRHLTKSHKETKESPSDRYSYSQGDQIAETRYLLLSSIEPYNEKERHNNHVRVNDILILVKLGRGIEMMWKPKSSRYGQSQNLSSHMKV